MFFNLILRYLHFSKTERSVINQILADSKVNPRYFAYCMLRTLIVASVGAGTKEQKQVYEWLKKEFPGAKDFQPVVPRPEAR